MTESSTKSLSSMSSLGGGDGLDLLPLPASAKLSTMRGIASALFKHLRVKELVADLHKAQLWPTWSLDNVRNDTLGLFLRRGLATRFLEDVGNNRILAAT